MPLLSNVAINKRVRIQRKLKLGIDTTEEIQEGELFIISLRLEECPITSEKLPGIQYQDNTTKKHSSKWLKSILSFAVTHLLFLYIRNLLRSNILSHD